MKATDVWSVEKNGVLIHYWWEVKCSQWKIKLISGKKKGWQEGEGKGEKKKRRRK